MSKQALSAAIIIAAREFLWLPRRKRKAIASLTFHALVIGALQKLFPSHY